MYAQQVYLQCAQCKSEKNNKHTSYIRYYYTCVVKNSPIIARRVYYLCELRRLYDWRRI